MPEGDTIHGIAVRLREAIGGETLQRVGGTAPSVRTRAAQLRGVAIERIEAVGKHLVVEFAGGWALHVHLGMTGRWRIGPPTGVRGDGSARVALETSRWAARCYGSPTTTIDRTPRIWDGIEYLGPDLTVRSPDLATVLERVHGAAAGASVSQALLDQSIASGIGNVYRNEVLFEAGVHPEHAVSELDDEVLAWMYRRASDHLRVNVGRARTTTGGRRRGTESYVYGRTGRPCRRCGTTIVQGRTTDHDRSTFWCPGCQPDPTDE